MTPRHLISVLLAIGVVLPVAGASAIPVSPAFQGSGSVAPSDGGAATATAGGGSETGTAAGTGSAAAADDGRNYTRLYVDDRYRHLELKPGGNDSMTVTVENGEDSPVEISPHLVVPELRGRPLPDAWLSIDAPDTTLAPDESVAVTVSVSVPDDAELGDYRGWVAFTDETIAHPGRPPQPVHAATVNVEVWREPTVRVRSGGHLYAQVEAGDRVTHEIVVENTGDAAVPLSPELATDRRGRCYGDCPVTVERSWLEIDAPAEIPAGESATVRVTIAPPEGAERGRYDAELDLGIRDPARDERDTHWQQVNLDFQVWRQPAEPFETEFEVSRDATSLELSLQPRSRRYPADERADADPVRFDVVMLTPDGKELQPERVRVSNRGFVDLSGSSRAGSSGDYAARGGETEFVYRVEDPAPGTWSVEIMPHNTMGFGYEIVREESDEE